MIKNKQLTLALLGLLLLWTLPIQAQDSITISNLNVRTGPGTHFPAMTQISARSNVTIEARNTIGDWIIIRSADDAIRGWVASRYVNFADGVALVNLPISTEKIGAARDSDIPDVQTTMPQTAVANGILLAQMYVRVGPDVSYAALGQFDTGTNVGIEGHYGEWLLVHGDGLRGWVYAPLVDMLGARLIDLPGLDEIIGDAVPTVIEDIEAVEIPLPPRDISAMEARLRSIPTLHNMVNGTVYEIFANGRAAGNNPRVFMKIGDSVTATQPFMSGFGRGDYNLGSNYDYLQEAIDFFNVSPRPGIANSFVNESFAAQSGFTSSAIFDGLWVNPAICQSGRPLTCEYELTRPGVAIILLGSVDLRLNDASLFQNNMYLVTRELIHRGVIPVLTTFPNHPDVMGDEAIYFNNLILNAAEAYNVPVINLWNATQALPDAGINLADPIHMTQGENYFHFDMGQEALYGVSLRNLLTLQALDTLRVNVLSQ